MAKKAYEEYVSRKENTKSETYILQDEDEYYNWANIKIDSFKNEVKSKHLKTKKTLILSRIPGGKKTHRRLSRALLKKKIK